jgi:hypothetical protein
MALPPNWMQELIDAVTDTVTPFDASLQLACHFYHSTEGFDEWEVTLFPDTTPLGGRLAHFSPSDALSVDAFELMQVFSSISNIRWQTKVVASDDDVGPHLSVEGDFHGNNVWLRIASNPPSQLLNEAPCERNTQRVK